MGSKVCEPASKIINFHGNFKLTRKQFKFSPRVSVINRQLSIAYVVSNRPALDLHFKFSECVAISIVNHPTTQNRYEYISLSAFHPGYSRR